MRDAINKRTGKPIPEAILKARADQQAQIRPVEGQRDFYTGAVRFGEGVHGAKYNPPGDVGPEAMGGEAPRVLNPKDAAAQGKVRLGLLPAAGMIHGALAATDGADKYGPYNWRTGPAISFMTYLDALERHIMALRDGETYDMKSGVHHLGHVIAGAAIILDATAPGQCVDDRPSVGPAASLLHMNQR